MHQWVKRLLVAVPLLVALGYGAIFVYTQWINDPEDEFTVDDARELAAATSPTAANPATSGAATTSASSEPFGTEPSTGDNVDGVWQVTAGSEFGYRVDEVLAGVSTTATGRGSDITGLIVIDGTTVTGGSFTVQVATIESDNGRRDGQFRGRVMETEQFPEATFTLTEAIELPAVPAVDGSVTAPVTGELTMHGVTQPVTFDVDAVRGAQRIAVVGSIPILFADFGIDNPSFGTVTTEDHGLLEFNLAFERA